MKSLLLSLVASLALAGCALTNIGFEIDNPTDTALELTLDGQAHTIAAHTSLSVSLPAGEHRLHTQALGDVQLLVYAGGEGGLINPTLSEYVVVSQVYADAGQGYAVAKNSIDLDGVAIEGPFTKVHGLFVQKDWAYGAHTPFPDSVATNRNAAVARRSKLFSAQDFITYLEAESGQQGAYAGANPEGYHAPKDTAPFTPTDLPPLHPLYEAHAKPAREWYARYLAATDPAEQKRLQKEHTQVSMAFVSATAALASKVSVADSEQVSAFGSAFSAAAYMSAAVRPAGGH